MIYRARDSIQRRRRRFIGSVVIISLFVFIILANFLFPNFLASITHLVGVPMFASRNAVGNGGEDFVSVLRSKLSLIVENRDLRERLAAAEALSVERDALKQENESLRSLLGRTDAEPAGILGAIISKPGYSPYDTLVIDVGAKQGVKAGDLVYADQSILIGQVATIGPYSANVLLYSSPSEKNDVMVGPEGLETVASGDGGGVYEIRLPQNANVHQGDIVTLSKAPQAVFGTVTEIAAIPSDSFERILFRSPVDITEIRYVTVKPGPPESSAPAVTNQTHATSTNHR